jgi:hypothetical protein
MSIAFLLVNISVLSGFFPLIAAAYNYRQLEPIVKLMAAFCLFSAIIDLTSLAIVYLHVVHSTFFLIHLFNLFAAVFFSTIYYRAFYEPILKKITLVLSAACMSVLVANALFIQGLETYPSISNTALSLLLILLSLMYFYQLLSRQEFMFIEKQGLFWINAGVLFYFSITIFLFMLWGKISIVSRSDFYMIQSVTNIIANLLYSVGLLCKPQKTTT